MLLLTIILAAVAAILCYRAFLKRFDTELRTAVHKHLSEMFPQARVYIERVNKDHQGSIIAQNVRLATLVDGKPFQVFAAKEVEVQGQLDVVDFIKQTIKINQVELIGVEVDAWQLSDGKWSIECLKPAEKKQQVNLPRIVLHDSVVRIRQGAARQAREIVIQGVQATVESVDLEKLLAHDRELARAVQLAEQNSGVRFRSQSQLLVQGSAQSSGLLEKLNVKCLIDPANKTLLTTGNFNTLFYSPKLLERLPAAFAQKLTQFTGMECEASSNFFLLTLVPNLPPTFICQGRLESGRLQDPRLPYPLERLSSDFNCSNSLLQLRNMKASSGGARLTFNTDIMGLSLDSPIDIEAEVENLELDKRLHQSLPPVVQQQWDKLQLAGKVSGRLKLTFDGRTWKPTASITCQQVSVKPWLFPYEFEQIEGEIQYEAGTVTSTCLRGRAGGQLLEASLELNHVSMPQGTQWIGKIQSHSLGVVAIDEELMAALTPVGKPPSGAEKFVRSLNITGGVELVNATLVRTSAESPKWQRTIEAHVFDGRLQYDKFRYPIYNIRGRIRNQGDDWWIDGFEGRNDSARILCSGVWKQVPQGLLPFKLDFVAHTVPMVEDLFLALPERAQTVWTELRPSGAIDKVTTTIQRLAANADLQTFATISEVRDATTVNGQSLRLHPEKLPLLLDDVTCEVHYNNGEVQIEHATALNGASRLELTGSCRSLANDRWQADINWLPSTRLMMDGQLIRAMPKSIQESMQKLNFYGPVSIIGKSQSIFGKNPQDFVSTWDCQLDIEDGKLAGGTHVSAMRGTVKVKGDVGNGKLNASGDFAMDAMRVLKTPVFNLQGPFVILNNKVFFGSNIQQALPNPNQETTPEVTASALAGTLKLNGYGSLDTGKFEVDARLENAQLSSLLRDIGINSQAPEATCNASLKFRGVPWNPQTYDGSGTVRLSDAKLYELPFMMRFLSVASVSNNDASAFQQADINFQLYGDHIPLQVAADGEVLRLRGEGWTNLRKEVELQLYTYVGRRAALSQVVTPLLAESRFSTFMMIEVNGTLDNPDMQRRPFPQLEATLQQIFPEVAEQRPIRDAIKNWRK
jgi:AsmA-like C-terminal region